jgi:hypothetical protein
LRVAIAEKSVVKSDTLSSVVPPPVVVAPDELGELGGGVVLLPDELLLSPPQAVMTRAPAARTAASANFLVCKVNP